MNEKNDQMNNQQVFEEKIQLQLKIQSLNVEMKSCQALFDQERQVLKLQNEQKLKEHEEKEIWSNLTIESLKSENKLLKDNINTDESSRNEKEKRFKSLEKDLEKRKQHINNCGVQFSNWKYKYKCIQESIEQIKEREEKMSKHIEVILFENERLKIINSHHRCVMSKLEIDRENDELIWGKNMNLKEEEISFLKDDLLASKMSVDGLNEIIEKSNSEIERLKEKLVTETQDKIELKAQLVNSNQTISVNVQLILDLKDKISNLEKEYEKNLNELNENRTILADFRLKNEIYINKLKSDINDLNDELDIERYEKNNLSKNFENVQERLYINQISLKEILEERQCRLNKKCDNFTQTKLANGLKSNLNKASQTDIKPDFTKNRETFTQTDTIRSKTIFSQTDEISAQQSNSVWSNSSNYGSKNMYFKNQFDQNESSNSKEAFGTFKNKNLVYDENNFGANRIFEKSLNKYLINSQKEKEITYSNLSELTQFQSRPVFSNRGLLTASNINTRKRVKFSETIIEYDENC